MTRWWYMTVAIAISAGLAGYFAGRRSVPARVETREVVRTVTVEAKREATQQTQAQATERERDKERVVRYVYREGCSGVPAEVTVTERDRTRDGTLALNTNTAMRETATGTSTARATASLTLRPPQLPAWSVGVGAGMRLDGERRYDLRVERRVLGPWWLGAYVRSDKSAGLSLRVEW